jgi:hypothetical protein
MSTCNHCGRYTDNSKLGEDCRFCKEVYAQGLADGIRRTETRVWNEAIEAAARVVQGLDDDDTRSTCR